MRRPSLAGPRATRASIPTRSRSRSGGWPKRPHPAQRAGPARDRPAAARAVTDRPAGAAAAGPTAGPPPRAPPPPHRGALLVAQEEARNHKWGGPLTPPLTPAGERGA